MNLKIGKILLNYDYTKSYGSQLIRSSSSVALNYSEAISAESKKDFIHKLSIVLKELRETFTCLEILQKSEIVQDNKQLLMSLKECNELISIFVTSIKTARKNY